MLTGVLIVTVLVAASALYVLPYFFKAYSRYKGTRIVTCPETKAQALVEIDARHAALTSVITKPDLRLDHCSRWPISQDCGQECLLTLDELPHDCLVQGVLMKWYRAKNCVFCGKHFGEVHWTDHRPALQSPDGKLFEWKDIAFEKVEQTLESHSPVCWDCYIVQSFRRDHPDLVVYRPWVNGRTEHTHKSQ
jgi:hypothetical protein